MGPWTTGEEQLSFDTAVTRTPGEWETDHCRRHDTCQPHIVPALVCRHLTHQSWLIGHQIDAARATELIRQSLPAIYIPYIRHTFYITPFNNFGVYAITLQWALKYSTYLKICNYIQHSKLWIQILVSSFRSSKK